MKRVLCSIWFALAGVILVAAPAAAQFDRGQISGRVKDAGGLIVPGVTVSAKNQQTQASTSTVSDSTGFYTFPNLPAGRYSVTAELQGFKKALREDIQLDADGSLALDFTLEPGALTEQVTVTAESPGFRPTLRCARRSSRRTSSRCRSQAVTRSAWLA